MALSPGTRFGPYEVTALIGAGGMGEVYRATDSNLGRQVAMKVLPEAFAADPDRLARFEREARTLASLNHLNIAQIHGFEKAGGVRALVMELVEGPTLADRIAHGPLPVEEALPIAKQITEALEAAHEQGVIHRDLKPANIKVRSDGTVKVLDFGLAKALDPSEPDLTTAPTITSPAMMTGVGMILGTAAYMSPEQARGKAVDKRTDIWAFGCVLYEMLAGRQAFAGNTISDVIASILTKEPDWTALPSSTPAPVRDLLRRCLQKDVHRRLHDIADARIELEDTLSGHREAPTISVARPQPFRRWTLLTLLAAVGAGAVIGAVLVRWGFQPTAVPPRVTRLEIAPTGVQALSLSGVENDFAITPDGSRIVYVGNNGTQLFVRPLDAVEPTLLAKGEIRGPFISPSGEWVGYFDGSERITKVATNGGAPVVLLRSINLRGATWASDEEVIFASLDPEIGLRRISANGGTATPLTRVNRAEGEQNHWWPEMLPDGRGVLFTILRQTGGIDAAEIAALDLRTGTTKVLVRGGTHARYTANGYLVYWAGESLRAIRFDLETLATAGTSTPVVPQVMSTPFGAVQASLSRDGTLAYVSGGFGTGARSGLMWIDRRGETTRVPLPERTYAYPRLSPDGTRIALVSLEQGYDVWLWDLRRATFTRATYGAAQDSFPTWTPDGRSLIFASSRSGGQQLFEQVADLTGGVRKLSEGSDNRHQPSSFSADGSRLVFSSTEMETGLDIVMMRLDGSGQIEPLVRTPANERNAEISPDGRWIAYQSDESGQYEIYVRPFPATDAGQWQITTTGGTRPLWAHTGRELFYLSPSDSSLMRLTIEPGTTWRASAPETLLDRPTPYHALWSSRTYDISLDDQRFLMLDYGTTSTSNSGRARIIVVQNWFEELKRLVPSN